MKYENLKKVNQVAKAIDDVTSNIKELKKAAAHIKIFDGPYVILTIGCSDQSPEEELQILGRNFIKAVISSKENKLKQLQDELAEL